MTDKTPNTKAPRLIGIKISIIISLLVSLAALASSSFLIEHYLRHKTNMPQWQLTAMRLNHEVQDTKTAIKHQLDLINKNIADQVNKIKSQQAHIAKQQQPGITSHTLSLMTTQTSISIAQSILLSHANAQDIAAVINQAMLNVPVMGNQTQPVQQLLARAHAQALALPTLQTSAALQQLDTIEASLSKLAFQPAIDTTKNKSEADSGITWRHPKTAVKQIWHHLKGLVVIHHDPTIGQHLLSASSRLNALELIMLHINHVRWNAITHSANYGASVDDLKTLISHYTQPTNAQQNILDEIKQLKNYTITYPTAQLNKLSQDLTQANQLIDQLLTHGEG